MSAATILHADLDAFFASVEQRDERRLRGRPVIVGGGVVLAASYEAKAFGVRTAMSERHARRLCPHAVVVKPRFSAYVEASKAVFEVFEDTSPLVEGLSIDEAFLDVRGMERAFGTPVEIAERLRRDVRDQVGLPITVGVARTKFLAKVASAVAKPDGLLVVPPDGELAFLHPLPVERLWGVGPVTAPSCAPVGSRRCGRSRSSGAAPRLDARAGVRAAPARARAQPRPAPRAHGPRRRSIGAQRALGRAPTSTGRPRRVARRSRRPRHPPHAGCRPSRPHGRPAPALRRLLAGDAVAHAAAGDRADARDPRHRARPARAATPTIEERGVTLVGVAVANLENDRELQLPLPFDPYSDGALDAALDSIRNRFGSDSVTRRCCSGAARAWRCRCSRTDRLRGGKTWQPLRFEPTMTATCRTVVLAATLLALALPGRAEAVDHVVLYVAPTKLATAASGPLAPWRLSAAVVGARSPGSLETFGVSLTRRSADGRTEEVHGVRAAPAGTVAFDGNAGRWRAQLGTTLTIRMAIAAAGREQPVEESQGCRGDLVTVPVALRGTFVLRTRHRVLRDDPAPRTARIRDVQPGRAARMRGTCLGALFAEHRLHRLPPCVLRPGGDDAALAGRGRVADAELCRPDHLRARRSRLVPRDAARAARLRPAHGRPPAFAVDLPAALAVRGSGTFTAAKTTETTDLCRRLESTGAFSGTFRTRFAGWGIRSTTFAATDFASYAEFAP